MNAVATLAGYTLLWLELRDRAADLVVRESSIRFLRPVRETITAVCVPPDVDEVATFREAFGRTGKARMSLRVHVEENSELAADFRATFVAVARDRRFRARN